MHRGARQRGQAFAEGLVGLAALALLFWAVPWIGRYHDMALVSAHASHHAAMHRTRAGADADMPASFSAPYAGAGLRWRGPDGEAALRGVAAGRERTALRVLAEPGQQHGAAARLREDWGVGQAASGLHVATVETRARAPLPFMDDLSFRRASVVMANAGHARSDAETQQRVAAGQHGWLYAAQSSHAAANRVVGHAASVDAAWGRPAPVLDWLTPWGGLVPSARLRGGGP